MKVLLVSATDFELAPILERCTGLKKLELSSLVTGVGMVATAFELAVFLASNKVDLALNVGLAGAFDRSLELGEVVQVTSDQFSEEGTEDGEEFIPISSLGLRAADEFPFENGILNKVYFAEQITLKKVEGITVNTVHGNDTTIQQVVERISPEVESMEGAAFIYACNKRAVPCMQLRAISNYVEKRDRSKWEIELALDNLAKTTEQFLKKLDAEA